MRLFNREIVEGLHLYCKNDGYPKLTSNIKFNSRCYHTGLGTPLDGLPLNGSVGLNDGRFRKPEM